MKKRVGSEAMQRQSGVIRGFAFSQLFYLSFLVGHENTQDEKGAKNQ